MSNDGETRRYVFAEHEQLGVIGTMRKSQAMLLAAAGAVAFGALYVAPGMLSILLAVTIGGAAAAGVMIPIRGRTADEWIPVLVNWVFRRSAVEGGYRSRTAAAGVVTSGRDALHAPPCLPPELVGVRILDVDHRNGVVGVIFDERTGTYTAAIKVVAGSFGFQDETDQNRRLEGYGLALAAAAQDGSSVRRIQWIERTLPKGGDELTSYLQRERDESVELTSTAVRSYLELIDSAAPTAQEHEILVALQVDQRSAGREVKRYGGGQEACCRALLSEIETFAENIARADLVALGILTPRLLAASVRDAFDPWGREARAAVAAVDPEREGCDPASMGPQATEGRWSHYRTDGATHISYYVKGWPRIPVHASFMLPLLMQTHVVRAVSVVMEPVPFSVAIRRAEALQTAEDADDMRAAESGRVSTARVRRRKMSVTRKDEELAAGHGEMRFAGFVTVSGRTAEEAEDNALTIERTALRTGLELQRLDGEQDQAFGFCLPLGRGLA